jgi:hypothetical protein
MIFKTMLNLDDRIWMTTMVTINIHLQAKSTSHIYHHHHLHDYMNRWLDINYAPYSQHLASTPDTAPSLPQSPSTADFTSVHHSP